MIYDLLVITPNDKVSKMIEEELPNYEVVCRSVRQINTGTTLDGLRYKFVVIDPLTLHLLNEDGKREVERLEYESRMWRGI